MRASAGALAALTSAALPQLALAQSSSELPFAHLEERYGGRLGVSAINTQTGRTAAYRENERFPMCSTFKFFLVADVLSHIEAGTIKAGQWVRYSAGDLLEYAPVTRARVAQGGMTVDALCAAAIELSDNTAANLLLSLVGGPAGATAYLRSFGDEITRLDRREPDLNSAIPGDPRDTTSPLAMRKLMNAILFGTSLNAASAGQLVGWMLKCQTGLNRLRAGLPNSWKIGDKTGNGRNKATNDIAVAWPGRKPLLITTYYVGSRASSEELTAVFRVVAENITHDLTT
ncbi:MAG TPA: class A beta-lactamase [Candidatus Cybelea sp.]|jgi:beta-lactamase class A|nr:class A beta-lactamase [Candidatus Cybelea sp.]